mmetsp:Transcript_59803/g.177238  ORF Transcript_59803/g.177238 Transcript_59803/m.177238 type:complete len:224 (+) Transcript_59803:818-1489(+)
MARPSFPAPPVTLVLDLSASSSSFPFLSLPSSPPFFPGTASFPNLLRPPNSASLAPPRTPSSSTVKPPSPRVVRSSLRAFTDPPFRSRNARSPMMSSSSSPASFAESLPSSLALASPPFFPPPPAFSAMSSALAPLVSLIFPCIMYLVMLFLWSVMALSASCMDSVANLVGWAKEWKPCTGRTDTAWGGRTVPSVGFGGGAAAPALLPSAAAASGGGAIDSST